MTRYEERVLTAPRVSAAGGARPTVAGQSPSAPMILVDDAEPLGPVLDQVVDTLVAVFRLHSHIGNVMNHVCGGRWGEVEQALRLILDPQSTDADLSPLGDNILDLLWAERGITGRILKPYFRELLNRLLLPRVASQLFAHFAGLLLEVEARRYRPPAPLANQEASQGTITMERDHNA